VGDVGSGEGYACVWAGEMWEISVPSPVFLNEPRTCLKIIQFFLNWVFLTASMLHLHVYKGKK